MCVIRNRINIYYTNFYWWNPQSTQTSINCRIISDETGMSITLKAQTMIIIIKW